MFAGLAVCKPDDQIGGRYRLRAFFRILRISAEFHHLVLF
jgi:hypothetical protein